MTYLMTASTDQALLQTPTFHWRRAAILSPLCPKIWENEQRLSPLCPKIWVSGQCCAVKT